VGHEFQSFFRGKAAKMHLFPQIEILHHRRTFVNGWVVFLSLIQKKCPTGHKKLAFPFPASQSWHKKRLDEWYHENLLSL